MMRMIDDGAMIDVELTFPGLAGWPQERLHTYVDNRPLRTAGETVLTHLHYTHISLVRSGCRVILNNSLT